MPSAFHRVWPSWLLCGFHRQFRLRAVSDGRQSLRSRGRSEPACENVKCRSVAFSNFSIIFFPARYLRDASGALLQYAVAVLAAAERSSQHLHPRPLPTLRGGGEKSSLFPDGNHG